MTDTTHAEPTNDDLAAVKHCQESYVKIRAELSKVIVGQDDVIEQVMIAIFGRGHALLEGVPGLAKTTAVECLAKGRLKLFVDDGTGHGYVSSPSSGSIVRRKGNSCSRAMRSTRCTLVSATSRVNTPATPTPLW